jgi:GxxExxY protein
MTDLIYPELSYHVQGAFFDVYNWFRHMGLSEKGWENALVIALEERGIDAAAQVEHELRYRGYRIGRFFTDVIADDKLLIEIKALEKLQPIHQAQVLTYLKVTGLQLGILVNFGPEALTVKRLPNFLSRRAPAPPRTEEIPPAEHLLYGDLTGAIRAFLYDVHTELGPGFMPMHYRRAFQIDLRRSDIPFEVRKEITIQYCGRPIETRPVRLLIVDGKVMVLPVTVREMTSTTCEQARQYLSYLGLKLGIVANFHATSLQLAAVSAKI